MACQLLILRLYRTKVEAIAVFLYLPLIDEQWLQADCWEHGESPVPAATLGRIE